MTLETWLRQTTSLLKENDVPTARLDSLVLLQDELGRDKAYILAHPEGKLSATAIIRLGLKAERRAKHEPLAYIRGKTEFYGREFIVSKDTLEPRPETETMIDLLNPQITSLKKVTPFTDGGNVGFSLVDVGTGSGCLAITVKLEFSYAVVMATEINEAALKNARQNAKKLKADIAFYQGDLLEPVSQPVDVVVANLPYVPAEHTINKAAMFEPAVAIFGGQDGLDLYRRLFFQIAKNLQFDSKKPRYVLTESLPFQHTELAQIAKRSGYKLKTNEDFIQVFELS